MTIEGCISNVIKEYIYSLMKMYAGCADYCADYQERERFTSATYFESIIWCFTMKECAYVGSIFVNKLQTSFYRSNIKAN